MSLNDIAGPNNYLWLLMKEIWGTPTTQLTTKKKVSKCVKDQNVKGQVKDQPLIRETQ